MTIKVLIINCNLWPISTFLEFTQTHNIIKRLSIHEQERVTLEVSNNLLSKVETQIARVVETLYTSWTPKFWREKEQQM